MRASTLIFQASLLALFGCAVTPYQAKLPPADRSCAASLQAVPVIPLVLSTSREAMVAIAPVEFGDIAQCIAGPEGKTDLALYAIDGITPPAQIDVAVQLSPGGTFAASAVLLDAQFQPLRHYTFDQFVRRGDEYSLHVFLNAAGPSPAYLMLAPDKDQVGKHDVTSTSVTNTMAIPAGPAMFIYNTGSEATLSRPLMEGGRLKVVARPQGSAAFSAD